MKISEIIIPKNNNITLIRLLLACTVIVYHTNAIHPIEKFFDLVKFLSPADSMGSFAVNAFFFLSGIMVVNSIISKQNTLYYWSHRILRIFPALILLVLITALIVGPIFSTLNIKSYFQEKETFNYIFQNIILQTQYTLPGVFVKHPAFGINGALWSIAWEFRCYVVTYLVYLIAIKKKYQKIIFTILFISIIIQSYFWSYFLFYSSSYISHSITLYFIGGLVVLYKDKIFLNIKSLIVLLIVLAAFKLFGFINRSLLFNVFSVFFILYLSYNKSFMKLSLKNDFSYGVYLWGFLIQQIIQSIFPELNGIIFNLMALIIAISIASVSWFFLEKPCMEFAKRLSKKNFKFQFSAIKI